jgi:hypothetical protein
MVWASKEVRERWKEKIQQQIASGLSIRRWCLNNQEDTHHFYYWKGRLFPSTLKRSSFKELPEKKSADLLLEYGKLRIHLDRDFDTATVKRLLTLLQEI